MAGLFGPQKQVFFPDSLAAACARAQSVLPDQVFFSLDADKFRKFTAMRDTPPAPNVGLERMMAIETP